MFSIRSAQRLATALEAVALGILVIAAIVLGVQVIASAAAEMQAGAAAFGVQLIESTLR